MLREKIFEKRYRENILDKYYKTVGDDSLKARALIEKLNYKNDPYLLKCLAVTYYDESYFNNDGSQKEHCNRRKMKLAEKYIIQAYLLNENCIDVLYTFGKIRNAFRQTDLAIICYERIIEIGRKKIPKHDTCTDRSLVQVIVNDSKFQLYRLYHDKGNYALSKRYLLRYKNGLKRGLDTIYKPLKNFLMD